ncbi:hypothetical protein CMI45_02095 [Candidatus Pacearchaeota archaeon]|nr:hypothetical protein [Candidatus Pacearchaeota archaeon]|tara:strand:- start:50 stop:367 length:318 start_codon:yes stop_codon:yes gene_type:complete
MAGISYIIIVVLFVIYYLAVLLIEKKIIDDPREIIEKFLAFALTYAGIALIYFSFTGKPFLTDTVEEYYIYIFLIGFIAILWAIPNLLSEFSFFRRFVRKGKKRN